VIGHRLELDRLHEARQLLPVAAVVSGIRKLRAQVGGFRLARASFISAAGWCQERDGGDERGERP
jgi:hypothetical protein